MSVSIAITEVSLRDGLQELALFLPTEVKAALVREYQNAGLDEIEVTSFVRPDRVPQLADAEELARLVCPDEHPGYSALVPNLVGLRRAADCGFHKVTVVLSASESHSLSNLGCAVSVGLSRACEVLRAASELHVDVRAAISMAFICPVDGKVPLRQIISLATTLLGEGASEVSLADTSGLASPDVIRVRTKAVSDATGKVPTLHLHDRLGSGFANLLAGLDAGARSFDASLTGIGGCPFAPDPVGNVPTEGIVEALGEKTGLNPARVAVAGRLLRAAIERDGAPLPGTSIRMSAGQ